MRISKIIKNERLSSSFFHLVIDYNGREPLPGQFYRIKTNMFIPRPFSVMNFDGKYLHFLYKVQGRGTSFLSNLTPGYNLFFTGPHGNGVESMDGESVLIIAGGVGIAPFIYLKKYFKDKRYTTIWGVKTKNDIIESFVDSNTFICIEDEGCLPTDIINDGEYDIVLACGPVGMLKEIQKNTEKETLLFLEGVMGCGTGLCYGCGIKTQNGYKRVCKDGPVFNGKEVIIED